ncbi:MAG: hypothetical protein WC641_01855 [Patescibacteria group bacterium]
MAKSIHSHPEKKKAYVISVNMGYGHERAAYGLRDLAQGEIITANGYPGIPDKDKKLWRESRAVYEAVSRLKPIPILGDAVFEVMDMLQRIPQFYPRRDMSATNLQIRQTYYFIEKLGLCRHLIEKLAQKPLPLICTFFLPAFAAEEFEYPGDIYIVVCDADMARAWAPRDPRKSRIRYFAPNGRVVERLRLYGVKSENIFLTGFPLPKELIGGPEGTIIKKDLTARLCNLDPNGIFLDKYHRTLEAELDHSTCALHGNHHLTVTFGIGGAGAQKALGRTVLESLSLKLKNNQLNFRLVVGTKKELEDYYRQSLKELKLYGRLNKNIFIDYFPDRRSYFIEFSKILRKTDILWTKPSELSFYCGAGIPIIMAPSIGSQEQFNRIWLKSVGAGVTQGDPRYTNEWLFDWINSGGLARMAWNGYIEAPTHGSYRIQSVLTDEKFPLPRLPMIV